MPVLDNYLNTVEAAKVLGFHMQTVERICRQNRIPAKKIHNMWLIDKSALDKYFVNRTIETKHIREYGQKLQNSRHRLGLSQSQLAVILGVSSAAVSRWEHCNRSPRAKHSQQILHWLQQIGQ